MPPETMGRTASAPVASRWLLILALACGPAQASEVPFAQWLAALRQEAVARGISPPILDTALRGVEPIPRVIELDRRQPERTMRFEQYLSRVVPERRVRRGREALDRNRDLLERVARRYRVQPRFIVALWGVETEFGRRSGGFPVIQSLVTLAYDGRRSRYFRGELLNALEILDQGHIQPQHMVGSWAGAMGQVQFMPSSFLRFAVDQDGDGRRDIWRDRADALASAANYLARSGWKDDQTWGRRVRVPKRLDPALIGLAVRKTLGEWQALGVRRADGRDLPGRDLSASLVLPGGAGGPAYLVYDNYRTLLKWNRSDYFATAVGTLADRIAAR